MLLSVEGGTFANFEKALTEGLYVRVMLGTLEIGLYVSTICLVLGYPVAHFLATASRRWATIGFVFLLLPFWTSLLVRTYAWMVLLGRNGVVNRFLLETGLIAEPLPLLYNTAGVLVGMVHVLLPFMVFPIYSIMRRVDRGLLLAAEGLGASPWRIFQRIYLPLTLPGVLAGTTLVFILSIGFYITPGAARRRSRVDDRCPDRETGARVPRLGIRGCPFRRPACRGADRVRGGFGV